LVATIVGLRTLEATVAVAGELAEWHAVLDGARDALANLYVADEPGQLARDGLAGALAGAAELARRSGPQVVLDVDLATEPEPAVRTAVYYCVLEALQNAAKHAHPSRVMVRVDRDGDELHFEVADDGVGFARGSDESPRGGLAQLGGRLDPLGGWLDVVSAPGAGVRVRGVVPLGAGVPAGM
jgi:signal transduction histidine kinase